MQPSEFFEKFRKAYLGDDIDSFMDLVDDSCVWVIEATGESFEGKAKVHELAARSVAARQHTPDMHMEVVNSVATENQMVLEYMHKAIVTADWPASQNRPPVGTKVAIPICLVCQLENYKFVSVHEYFDLGTVIAGHPTQKLYS